MAEVEVEVDPQEVGLAADRLERLGRHLRGYVERGQLPGWSVALTRAGKVVHVEHAGTADLAGERPVGPDTIWRVFSMTKPVTAVAALMLWEEGAFELKDPVHAFVPSFRDQRVYRSGSSLAMVTEPLRDPMQLWHLFTHTSGLTYGFLRAHPVDERYRQAGFDWDESFGGDLAAACDAWASVPLLFQPGSEWNYSVSTDVLGRVVEVVAGMPLDEFFRTRIFGPLGMTDTAFWCPEAQQHRLAQLTMPGAGPERRAVATGALGERATRPPALLSGGGGLVSTLGDYQRFVTMLRNGGELDGVRLLSPRTVRMMASNHLPGGADLEAFGRPLFAETTFDGVGFGLGVSVTIDPIKGKVPGSVGDYGWGGAASTYFWVDPVLDLTVLFMTQLWPSSSWPLRSQLKQLVHQAVVGS
jgi:CubicO group peptidase (beta-lactamase class C family)